MTVLGVAQKRDPFLLPGWRGSAPAPLKERGHLAHIRKTTPEPAENVAAVFNRHAQYLKIGLAVKPEFES